jgi:hypothetical protein
MLSRATGRKRKSIERERKESFLSSFIIYNCTVAHAQKKKQSKPTEVKAFFVPSFRKDLKKLQSNLGL